MVALVQGNIMRLVNNNIVVGKPQIYGENKMSLIKGIDNLSKKQFIMKRLGLSRTSLACLCGTGCSGKSLLLQYLSVCVSTGTKFFDSFDVEKGKVVFIDQEQSEDQYQLRLERICGALNITEVLIERAVLLNRLDSPKLDQEFLEKELIELFTGSVLVIIDSLKATTEGDENSSCIEKTLKMLKRVAEKANCCVLVCHHKGKGKDSKQSGRGHSSIYDSFDVQIDIDCVDEKYNLRCAKMRDGKYFNGIQYTILDKGSFVEAQNCTSELHFEMLNDKVRTAGDSQKDKILKQLSENTEPMNNTELYALVKGDKTKFVNIISNLLQENLIEQSKGIKNARLFKITAKGMVALAFNSEQ
jgi:archaellum biogenesis ATPase FlaH